ncbi:DNA mismatch repair protein MutS [Eubacterium sp.]|uniref:DNA mismatch repair protein MutS n=1 Tax=Eubacterium sp. TaxID=142586 RepID=UPI0030D784EB
MKKKTDIDIISELAKLVDSHVHHYKEDFDIDRRLIAEAAKASLPEDKTLIWFCRENGTHCLRESQAFIQDTREHSTLRFYAEQSGEDITARVVVPKKVKGSKVIGDVFEVNFQSLAFKVANYSIAPMMTQMTFADGYQQEVPFHKSLRQAELLVQDHGRISSLHVVPADKQALSDILLKQKKTRDSLPEAQKKEVLAPLPIAEYQKYQALKQERPDALVCYAQNGYFELYGDDAEKAAPILGSKLLKKELEGGGHVLVTGFREDEWPASTSKLWSKGNDVFLSRTGEDGTQETVKDLRGEDYFPVGLEWCINDQIYRITDVNYAADTVTLVNLSNPDLPPIVHDSIREFKEVSEMYGMPFSHEEAAEMKKAFLAEKKSATTKMQPKKSVLAKLKESSKEATSRQNQKNPTKKKAKTNEREM